jgi:hypothetical protein
MGLDYLELQDHWNVWAGNQEFVIVLTYSMLDLNNQFILLDKDILAAPVQLTDLFLFRNTLKCLWHRRCL